MNNILARYNTIFNGARKGVAYPTKDLQLIVYNDTYEEEGTTYLRTSTGVGIPLVSGTGLDAIYDFSGLNDLRLNKNAYLGNSFSLPEYYDYPYSASIYFDTGNPYHWKLTDFHYANFLEQSLTVDNIAFLKALATTDTSNVIASWDKLFIYTTALAGDNLAKMKTYIGIQALFFSNELNISANAASDPNGNEANAITGFVKAPQLDILESQSVVKTTGNYCIKADANSIPTNAASFSIDFESIEWGDFVSGIPVVLSFDIRHIGSGRIWVAAYGNSAYSTTNILKSLDSTKPEDLNFTTVSAEFIYDSVNTRYLVFRENSPTNDGGIYLDNLSAKHKYENYYAS